MKSIAFSTLFALATVFSFAQDAEETGGYFSKDNYLGLTAAIGAGEFSGALDWHHLHGLGEKKKFRLGYGIRFTNYMGSDVEYLTAPADLTAEGDAKYDTLTVASPGMSALNLTIQIQYAISDKLSVGFNIDAIGIAFGKEISGDFQTSETTDSHLLEHWPTYGILGDRTVKATPTSPNMLLMGDNDIGTLNSEPLYVQYWFSEKLAVKVAAGFLFTEYTTDKHLTFGNDRFRRKSMMAAIGVTFAP